MTHPDYPIGEQSFRKIREARQVYVDKTGFIKRFLNGGYYFLGRPRRFGKSLFLSTLKSFFSGERELFQGLEADTFDWGWDKFPVLHIDLNVGCYESEENLLSRLDILVREWEEKYSCSLENGGLPERFEYLIRRIHEQTGRRVVVLVDEYDKPLVGALKDRRLLERFRDILSTFYSCLKSEAEHLHLVFMTGVSRFGKLTVFSGLNNIQDISFDRRFNAVCGITESELISTFKIGIQELCDEYDCDADEVRRELKARYDGYRFCRKGEDIYNPFSILNVMDTLEYRNYWTLSGTPTLLIHQIQKFDINIESLINSRCSEEILSGLDLVYSNPLALLYQTGYLTIKGYDPESRLYTLGIPNTEVKEGFFGYMLPYYLSIPDRDTNLCITKFVEDFRAGNAEKVMEQLKSLFSGFSYRLNMDAEQNIQNALMMFMTLLGFRITAEYTTSEGRIDLLVVTEKFYYIIELKLNGSPEKALQQIEERDYALPFLFDNRQIIEIGANFSTEKRTLSDWKIVRL
jgi:sugar-specific transcriptional regulator TrmB